MVKWLLVLCFAGGIFLAWQNWSLLTVQGQQLLRQVSLKMGKGTGPGSIAVKQADGSTTEISVPLSTESWAQRDLCGLRMSLPFPLESIGDSLQTAQLPPGSQLEMYAGKSFTHEIILTHATYPTIQPLPLWAFNISPGPTADRYGLQVFPKNPPTLLKGLRAQRTDCLTKASPHVRYRMLLLERASQMWLIETHTGENDNAFESSFQKIALSVQPL